MAPNMNLKLAGLDIREIMILQIKGGTTMEKENKVKPEEKRNSVLISMAPNMNLKLAGLDIREIMILQIKGGTTMEKEHKVKQVEIKDYRLSFINFPNFFALFTLFSFFFGVSFLFLFGDAFLGQESSVCCTQFFNFDL